MIARKNSLSSPTIPFHKFYLSNNNNDNKSPSLRSLPTICSPHVKSNQPVRRLATNSSPRLYPEYVMFGTYRSNAETMDFDMDGIKFTNVSPNSIETKFKYHIMIPFIEMQELMFCRNSSLNAIFVKPTKVSNDKIQECMYLGKDSKNGLKFDIDSRGISHLIIKEFFLEFCYLLSDK
jgi:hypothetical protein